MTFGFLRRLVKGNIPDDPTVDWPNIAAATPVVDLANKKIGRLRFGAPFDEAHYLGKPDLVRRTNPGYLELVYARGGFQIDFENNLLAYAAFFVGPDEQQPSVQGLQYSCPALHTGQRFNSQTTKSELVRIYGAADHVDNMDAGDVILGFCTDRLILEFELNLENCLKRWNLYPEREIPQ